MSEPTTAGCIAISHHRNGITGAPFDVAIMTYQGRDMLVIDFGDIGGSPAVAAFDLRKLEKRDIAFGSNSWRGDVYAPLIREMITKAEGGGA